MQDFGDKLKSYSLFTFEKRLFAKMLTFANTIVGNGSSPRKLKELIKEKSIDEEISDFGSYALRSGTAKKSEITRTKFGHLTFNYFLFFIRLISKFSSLINFNIKCDAFKSNLTYNVNILLKVFLFNFPKFNLPYQTIGFKKQKTL